MNCHIIPKCYLKSWKIPNTNSSIFIFDKNKTRATNNNKNIENLSDTNFAIKDKYLINIFNKHYMHKFYTQFSVVINELNVTATCNGTKILNFNDYINNLEYIDNWTYMAADGTITETSIIVDLWTEKVSKSIESYFANNVEYNWPIIKNYVTTQIMPKQGKVPAEHKEFLFEFAVVQFLRRIENMQAMGLSNIITTLNQAFDINYFDSSYEESHWLMQLYGYVIKKDTNSVLNSIQYISDNYQPCFLISTGSAEFITSDNPCYRVKDSINPFVSGIYLPINPKVCLFLCNLNSNTDKNTYYIFDINDQNVKFINNQTKNHAIKELAYHSDDISNLFCNCSDNSNWELIPKTLFNELCNK